jgi:RNA polymerase sigma factor (sigma-70 family)
MKNRRFDTQREATSRPDESQASGTSSRFPREEAFWRSWLSTGARRVPIDRRRARGAEAQLKKVLIGAPSGAVDFSSAMARQAIDEALHELPPRHKQVVKLAYFGGLTNREIAQELGLNVSEVRRMLQASLAAVGAHFERGRAKGRRAIQDLALLPWLKGIGDSVQRVSWPSFDHVLQTGVVAVMTAAAAALLVTHPAPSHTGHAHKPPHIAAVGSAGSNVLQAHHATVVDVVADIETTSLPGQTNAVASLTALPDKVKAAVKVPVSLTTPLPLPKPPVSSLPQLPFGA